MLGLCFYVSIFAQIGAQNIAHLPNQLTASERFDHGSGPTEIEVEFDKLSGIAVGSAVLAEGQLIGNVSEILASQTQELSDNDSINTYTVKVKIAPSHRGLLRQGTVALLLSPLSATRARPETVVELLLPARNSSSMVLQNGEKIIGFSSYEDFWSADFTKRSAKSLLPGRRLG